MSFSSLNGIKEEDIGEGSVETPKLQSSVTRRLSTNLIDRVSKFNSNASDGSFLSPMQSFKGPIPSSFSKAPPIKISPVVKRLNPTKTLETRLKNFQGNSSDREFLKVDLLSPEEVKRLVKTSRNNHRLPSLLNRYEQYSESESEQRHEHASKIAAKERQRRQGCTKSEDERQELMKQNRAGLLRRGSERILVDAEVSKTLNDAENDMVRDEVRAVQYDFTNFVSPSFPKTEMQEKLILSVIERSFVFAEFRKYGRARCEGVLDMLVDAFEPVEFQPGHILLHPDLKKKNDEFFIVESGRVDFKVDGKAVAEIAEVGGYFGELSLLYNARSERMVSVYESSSREARLLKINQKTFRGILKTCSKQAAQEKRDALLGVDFLFDLIKENENMIRRLSSIMIREEMVADDIFTLSLDNTFVVIESGRIQLGDENETFESGDYFGSQALIRTESDQSVTETDMIACSENAVFFRIDNHSMGQIVGPSRLQNLMDMRRFATTGLIEKANLSSDAFDFMADKIAEKKICKDENTTLEVGQNDPPAVYVVREGALLVSSHDHSTGDQIETVVTAGNVFGVEQLELSMKDGKPTYQRHGGLKASISGDKSSSIGVLPLSEVKVHTKEEFTDSSIDCGKNEETFELKSPHSESSILQLRAKVRNLVQDNISLDDLEKIRLLGEGEFGEVWLVAADVFRDGSSEKKQKFALKTQLIEADNRGVDAIDEILREIEIMKEFKHHQIVDLVDTYQDETSIHMLLRLVPYGELWDRMHVEDDQGNWTSGVPEDHAKFYALSIADTLNYIHSKGIIYRDLKPENVLIDEDGYPVFIDFGFAKFCPDKTFTFVGTPNYVAPEIITNAGHNRCVDYWAFGVTVYEMVTGENPFFFEGVDQVSLYHSICHEKYFPLKNQSEVFVDFIDKILNKDPVERLGMLHGGVKDILEHGWFDGVDLARIQAKSFPAPWKPTELTHDGFESLKSEEKELSQTFESSLSMNDVIGSFSSINEEKEGDEQSASSSSKSRDTIEPFTATSPRFGYNREPSISSHSSRLREFEEPCTPSSKFGDAEDSVTSSRSISGEVHELTFALNSQPDEVEEPMRSPDSKSKSTKRKKKPRKKKSTESNSNNSRSNSCGSGSNTYDDPNEFQFVSLEKSGPLRRNPNMRRSMAEKKERRMRRDLLRNSFNNFGID